MDETDVRRIAAQEFTTLERAAAAAVMLDELASVPASQLSPPSRGELVRATKRRLARRRDYGRSDYRSAGFH